MHSFLVKLGYFATAFLRAFVICGATLVIAKGTVLGVDVAGFAAGVTGSWRANSSSCSATRDTAERTSRLALAVACALSLTTHETCSRMFAISHRYGLSPASAQARRKVGS